MSGCGYISLHRKVFEHWIYQERRVFSKFEAWTDILLNVNHSDQKVMLSGSLLECKRGESLYSLETWGKRWKWEKSKVRRFLKILEDDRMIVLKSETKTTRLKVCNYDSYQGKRNANETVTLPQTTPNNNDNNDKEYYMSIFETFRKQYPGNKRGLDTEFKYFTKKHKDWETVLPLLTPALNKEKHNKTARKANTGWVEDWKILSTWINKRCWEQELGVIEVKKQALPVGITN